MKGVGREFTKPDASYIPGSVHPHLSPFGLTRSLLRANGRVHLARISAHSPSISRAPLTGHRIFFFYLLFFPPENYSFPGVSSLSTACTFAL